MEQGIVNGAQGIVTQVTVGSKTNKTESTVTVLFDNGNVWYIERVQYIPPFSYLKSKTCVDMFKQFPLQLSYCLNTHKLQGATLHSCTVLWDDILPHYNALYVALSLCGQNNFKI